MVTYDNTRPWQFVFFCLVPDDGIEKREEKNDSRPKAFKFECQICISRFKTVKEKWKQEDKRDNEPKGEPQFPKRGEYITKDLQRLIRTKLRISRKFAR
jgi:hypothetical protein